MALKGDRARFREDLLAWSQDNLREFPWREAEASPYEILIAEMFLNVTRTEVMEKVYPAFVQRYPTFHALRSADREELIEVIRPIGLYNTRADALLEIAETLAGEPFPRTKEELLELPRVGEYVASAVTCMAFGDDEAMMDRNVARVYSRVFDKKFSQDAPGAEAWEFAHEMIPSGDAARYNLALIDFASIRCTAPTPKCDGCFAAEYCRYNQRIDDG